MSDSALTLYEVETELAEAAGKVSELQDQPSQEPQDLELALQILEAYITESQEKRNRVGKFLETLTASASAIDEEIKRLGERKKRILNTHEHMCQYILAVMAKIGVTKLESPLFSFKARKNPPSVVIDSEELIPWEFMKQPPPPKSKPDKKAIKEAIEAGAKVPGARLTQETRLVIDQ